MLVTSLLLLISSIATSQHIRNNWTSCEEFLHDTVFDPKSVLNIDWKIFYFWNPVVETSYIIRFRRPSKLMVDRFRIELSEELKPPVVWDDAELFLESSIDFNALFLKTNVSGFYRIIPADAFDYPSVPTLMFALKVVKPGYLGISNCKHRLCYALAPVDKMPLDHQLDEAARTLGFVGDSNRSYISMTAGMSMRPPAYYRHELDDDDDLDMELYHNRLEMF